MNSEPPSPRAVEILGLTDGGQTAEDVAKKLAAFLRTAKSSLDLALYDIRLPDPVGSIIADEFRAASERGVEVRLAYNGDTARPSALHPPPQTRPDILAELPIETREIPGVPDLMHHKYVVRDRASVWSGSTNWNLDSWSLQENVIITVDSAGIAGAFHRNFEELWKNAQVVRSGLERPRRVDVGGIPVTPWFTPGHGPELSQQIATRIGQAKQRIRIASPVITSAPILGTLAELGAKKGGGVDIAGVVDEPQVDRVFEQWHEDNGRWKIPLLATTLTTLPFSGKPSTPWGPATVHNFMHAKVTVADDTVFIGSFNLSRSGEQNAENVLEIDDAALADQMAEYIDQVRARYPASTIPALAAATIASTSSA